MFMKIKYPHYMASFPNWLLAYEVYWKSSYYFQQDLRQTQFVKKTKITYSLQLYVI